MRGLVKRLRSTRGGVFSQPGDDDILRLMGIVVDGEDGTCVTLLGLLALGRYPQQFLPQLDATFVVYATTTGEPLADGTRFIDNQSIDGPVPTMVAEALAAVRRNMKRRSVIVGLGREDRWEYPEEAVREIVANALMHRDYHPLAQGAQVRIELYPDRLGVTSPGGLYGPIAREDLGAEPQSSSRNARLAKLLEDVEVAGTVERYVRTEARVSSPLPLLFEPLASNRRSSSTPSGSFEWSSATTGCSMRKRSTGSRRSTPSA